MNYQPMDRCVWQFPAWLSCAVLLACLAVISPINVHIVIAQESDRELTVASADDGQPPVPVARVSPVASVPTTAPNLADETTRENAPSEVTSEAELATLSTISASPEVVETTPSQPDAVRSLSVEPGSRPLLPKDRPAWVGALPELSTNQHYLYVGSIPTSNESEADAALDEPLLAAVHTYIDDEVIHQRGAAPAMPIDAGFIRKNLIDAPAGYMAELSTSEGPMYQKWVTVRITPEQRELFRGWHTQAMQRERLGPLGTALFLLVGGVALSHLALRRWHGPLNLPVVNHQTPIEPPIATASSGSLTWLWVTFFCILVLPAMMLFWFVGRNAGPRITTNGHMMHYVDEVHFPVSKIPSPPAPPEVVFPNQIRVENSEGTRAIIIHDQSHK